MIFSESGDSRQIFTCLKVDMSMFCNWLRSSLLVWNTQGKDSLVCIAHNLGNRSGFSISPEISGSCQATPAVHLRACCHALDAGKTIASARQAQKVRVRCEIILTKSREIFRSVEVFAFTATWRRASRMRSRDIENV